jgi:hypothetical protein
MQNKNLRTLLADATPEHTTVVLDLLNFILFSPFLCEVFLLIFPFVVFVAIFLFAVLLLGRSSSIVELGIIVNLGIQVSPRSSLEHEVLHGLEVLALPH